MKQETNGGSFIFGRYSAISGSEQAAIHHPPTTRLPPTIHPRTYPVQQYSNAAVRRAIHLTGEQQPLRWLQCSRAGRNYYSPPRRGPSEGAPGVVVAFSIALTARALGIVLALPILGTASGDGCTLL